MLSTPASQTDVQVNFAGLVLPEGAPLLILPGRLSQCELVQFLTWDSISPLRFMCGRTIAHDSEKGGSRRRARVTRLLLNSGKAGACSADGGVASLPQQGITEFTGFVPNVGYFHMVRHGVDLLRVSKDVAEVDVRAIGFENASAITFLEGGDSFGRLVPAAIDTAWRVSLDAEQVGATSILPAGEYAVSVIGSKGAGVLMTRIVRVRPGNSTLVLRKSPEPGSNRRNPGK